MDPRRILMSISSKSAYWCRLYKSAEVAINIAVDPMKQTQDIIPRLSEPKSLVERWGSRTHIVFDFHHDGYSLEDADLAGHGDLLFIVVWLSGNEAVEGATASLKISQS